MSFCFLNMRRQLSRGLLILITASVTTSAFAGRVPTRYNERYQSLFAEQELFRKRPELLACVAFARNFAQTSRDSVFNKLRFTAKSVQTAYVWEGLYQGVAHQKVTIYGEGRIRAYSFFENWEPAVIRCDVPIQGAPSIDLEVAKDERSGDAPDINPSANVIKN
jgi:hypothetical protein